MKKKDCIAKTVVTSSAEETVRAVMCSGLKGYRVFFILESLFVRSFKGRMLLCITNRISICIVFRGTK